MEEQSDKQQEMRDDASPSGDAARWAEEIRHARTHVEQFRRQGDQVIKRYLDKRDSRDDDKHKLNLFNADIGTLASLLMGQTPKVDVSRRFSDFGDEVARVASELLERLLNNDIERDSDTYALALQDALSDWLKPGLGVVRVRYEREEGEAEQVAPIKDEQGNEQAPGYLKPAPVEREEACIDYVHWRDFLWSPAKTWTEVRWVAFRAQMSRSQLQKRFGDKGTRAPLNTSAAQMSDTEAGKDHPWSRADVWEVWSREDRRVYWWVEGFDETLDEKADPLELEAFFPCPRPLAANTTTDAWLPKADFVLAQDLYTEIDDLTTRIDQLSKALRLVGIYDGTQQELQQILSGVDSKMVPISNMAALGEKGGLETVLQWVPIEHVAQVLQQLELQRQSKISLLREITGMSDIMRGQAAAHATATEQQIKAKFASVRVQRMQDEFARFASDVQRLKAEIVSKFFDPQTIVERSNVQFMPQADQQLAQQAVGLIKSAFYTWRVAVRPEAVSLTDYASLKAERMEFLQALGGLVPQIVQAGQLMPTSLPFLLQMLRWVVSGFRGASSIEGVLDQAIISAQQAAQRPPPAAPPNPQLQVAQVKAQAEGAKAQADIQKTGIDMAMQRETAVLQQQKLQGDLQLQALKLAQAHAKAQQQTTGLQRGI